jgi:hypothetical protein
MVKRSPQCGLKHQKEKGSMAYFAGLDVSVKETHSVADQAQAGWNCHVLFSSGHVCHGKTAGLTVRGQLPEHLSGTGIATKRARRSKRRMSFADWYPLLPVIDRQCRMGCRICSCRTATATATRGAHGRNLILPPVDLFSRWPDRCLPWPTAPRRRVPSCPPSVMPSSDITLA